MYTVFKCQIQNYVVEYGQKMQTQLKWPAINADPLEILWQKKYIYIKTVVLKTETKSQLWLNVRLQSCLEHTDSVWIKVDTPSRIIFTAVVSWWTKERIMSMGNFPGLSHSFDFLLVASYSWFHEKDCIQ